MFQLTPYLGKIENYILASIEVENLEELESDNPKNLFRMGSFSRENRIGCKAESIDKIEHILKTQQDLLSFCTSRKCEDCDFNGEECKDKKFYNLGTISEKEVAYNYNLILFARKVVSGIPKNQEKYLITVRYIALIVVHAMIISQILTKLAKKSHKRKKTMESLQCCVGAMPKLTQS